MADVRLSTPRLRVILADDSVLEVQVTNADLVRWDMTRQKQRWPTDVREAPFLWLTFVAWCALRRTSSIPQETTWESFSETTQEVSDLSESEGTDDDTRPTQPGAEPI